MRRARWKRKNVRRVGLRRRRPPAAGGGWLAIPCGSQGRKRAALGETSSPGRSGIHPAPLFAAAGRWSMRGAAWANATASTTARAARSEAERAERGAGQMRPCTPTQDAPSATGRQYRPGRRPKRARRPARIGAGTDTSTSVARGGPLHRSAPSAFFSSTGRGAFSFWARPKREWGAHPPWERPPAGAESPGRQIAAPTASPEESPTLGAGREKETAGLPASRLAVCSYAKNPLRIRSSASSSVRPRVSSFKS